MNKCNPNLEQGQIRYFDPTIKNIDFQSQESGTSFKSPKIHIFNHRSQEYHKQARNSCNTNLESEQIGYKDPTITN